MSRRLTQTPGEADAPHFLSSLKEFPATLADARRYIAERRAAWRALIDSSGPYLPPPSQNDNRRPLRPN